MTTTAEAQAPPVQITRDARGIDAAVALLSGPDASLEDVAMLLRRVAVADVDAISTIDAAGRIQGLCALAAKVLRDQWPQEIRVAPPAAVVEVVRDASRPCASPFCSERVQAWDDAACSEECSRTAHLNGCDQ